MKSTKALAQWLGFVAAFKILGQLGLLDWLGRPLLAYSVCFLVDRHVASNEVKSQILKWVGKDYTRGGLVYVVNRMFDRIYTYPLLRFRALFRSSFYTIVWLASYWLIIEPFDPAGLRGIKHLWIIHPYSLILSACTIISGFLISDYGSLFIVRRCLSLGENHLFIALLFAICGQVFAVVAAQLLMTEILPFLVAHYLNGVSFYLVYRHFLVSHALIIHNPLLFFIEIFPAFIHVVWLPLFVVGAIGLKILYPILQAQRLAQGLIRQGDQHPVEASGVVAAVAIFAITVAWKLAMVI